MEREIRAQEEESKAVLSKTDINNLLLRACRIVGEKNRNSGRAVQVAYQLMTIRKSKGLYSSNEPRRKDELLLRLVEEMEAIVKPTKRVFGLAAITRVCERTSRSKVVADGKVVQSALNDIFPFPHVQQEISRLVTLFVDLFKRNGEKAPWKSSLPFKEELFLRVSKKAEQLFSENPFSKAVRGLEITAKEAAENEMEHNETPFEKAAKELGFVAKEIDNVREPSATTSGTTDFCEKRFEFKKNTSARAAPVEGATATISSCVSAQQSGATAEDITAMTATGSMAEQDMSVEDVLSRVKSRLTRENCDSIHALHLALRIIDQRYAKGRYNGRGKALEDEIMQEMNYMIKFAKKVFDTPGMTERTGSTVECLTTYEARAVESGLKKMYSQPEVKSCISLLVDRYLSLCHRENKPPWKSNLSFKEELFLRVWKRAEKQYTESPYQNSRTLLPVVGWKSRDMSNELSTNSHLHLNLNDTSSDVPVSSSTVSLDKSVATGDSTKPVTADFKNIGEGDARNSKPLSLASERTGGSFVGATGRSGNDNTGGITEIAPDVGEAAATSDEIEAVISRVKDRLRHKHSENVNALRLALRIIDEKHSKGAFRVASDSREAFLYDEMVHMIEFAKRALDRPAVFVEKKEDYVRRLGCRVGS